MNRQEFLEALSAQLEPLSEAERERSLAYYAEMIDDRVEEGLSEEEAVAQLDPVEWIAGEILQNAPVKIQIQNRRRLHVWQIVLLVLSSPVWVVLLMAAIVVLLALMIVIWSLIASLWATTVGLALGVPMSLVASGIALFQGNFLRSFACTGVVCVAAGMAVLLLFAAKRATHGAAWLTRICWGKIRRAR